MYIQHTACRACGFGAAPQGIKINQTEKLIEVFDLGIQPLANDFRREYEAHSGFAPLKVMLCPQCNLGQLSVTVDPKVLYSNYPYVTSPSQMMADHFGSLVADIQAEDVGRVVLEIGSNDGKLLKVMQGNGFAVTGLDPAENLVAIANDNGIPTVCEFWDSKVAKTLPAYDVVIGRHIFCHADDWKDFVRGLEYVTHIKSIICLEVPYVGDLLSNNEFDTIYHEHLSYLSIKSVHELLKKTDLFLYKIIRYPIHGGAVMLILRHKNSGYGPDESVTEFKENCGLNRWKEFAVASKEKISSLKSAVKSFCVNGKSVVGLGASAKSTVWVNACGFSRKEIQFISDNTPQKQLTFSPGTDIPIVDEGAIMRDLPNYAIMFCWNYKDEVLKKFDQERSRGVKFIVPVREVEVL